MENKIVIIEVHEGIAEVIHTPENIDVHIIDFDCLENGECPFCGGNLKIIEGYRNNNIWVKGSLYCVEDNIDWNKFDAKNYFGIKEK